MNQILLHESVGGRDFQGLTKAPTIDARDALHLHCLMSTSKNEGALVSQHDLSLSLVGFRVYKNLNLGKRPHTREIRRDVKKNWVLFFEEVCFNLLSLFHLNKMHVLVMCNSIPLNIIVEVTSGCKV